jgi:hypothetical protein
MQPRRLVEFVAQAARKVPESLQDTLRPELEYLFADPPPRAITVSYCYTGYTSEPSREKAILRVEVKGESGFGTHIVKIGTPVKVGCDYDGWQACMRGIEFASRIFLPVQRHDLSGGRVAVVYRDAYTLYGPEGLASQPVSLEEAIHWAVLDDRPALLSIERAIIQTYADLGRWLYSLSSEDAGSAGDFYKARLKKSLCNWMPESADKEQQPLAGWRGELRRDAIWLFCGKDAPDSDKPAVYLDPCDYVTYALRTGTIAPTLLGRGHGDLHGRNILVCVYRGEVDYPAVFDYGDMGIKNVLAWDFVKLETELKVRLLPILYRDAATREGLLQKSSRARPHAVMVRGLVDDRASRADRLEFAFRFERMLAERTAKIEARADAEMRQPPGGIIEGEPPMLARLLAILLRIRQEAALWLGYERGRQHRWREEYDFAMAVYGLVHARPDWDYEPTQAECALVGAGVAAANLRAGQELHRTMIHQVDAGLSQRLPAELFPSYRVPLAIADRWWKNGRIDEAANLVRRFFADNTPQQFGHAVPLLAEHALLLAEQGDHARAQQILRPLQEGCRLFGDFETLGRIGRAYKESGDDKWEKNPVPFAELPQKPPWQMYRHALAIYTEAFDLSGAYYPGINAATLALLCGDVQQARALARKVLEQCAKEDVDGESAVWVFASEGEACLLVGREDAAGYYAAALDELDPSQPRLAQSMYNQLCRLWQALGGDALEPVLQTFAQRPAFWSQLTPGPVGDCGGRKKPASS